MTKIYLAGRIMDLSMEEAEGWRNVAINSLEYDNHDPQLPTKFHCINPLRRNYNITTFQSPSEIVGLDKNDIDKSDILLVNITKPSWGTAMEIFYAWQQNKIIVCFGEQYNKISPWIKYHSTRIFTHMQDAIDYIKENF